MLYRMCSLRAFVVPKKRTGKGSVERTDKGEEQATLGDGVTRSNAGNTREKGVSHTITFSNFEG